MGGIGAKLEAKKIKKKNQTVTYCLPIRNNKRQKYFKNNRKNIWSINKNHLPLHPQSREMRSIKKNEKKLPEKFGR